MANWISKQKGKGEKVLRQITADGSNVMTSEANKAWRALILFNRATSGLPKDHPDGKIYNPNQTIGKGYSLRNPQRNPKLNQKTKDSWRTIVAASGHVDRNLPWDTSVDIVTDPAKGKFAYNALDQHTQSTSLNKKNQVIIYNLTSNGSYQYIVLQNRPTEITYQGETLWANIHSMGRNNPMYHYTGAEDTFQINVDWYCSDPDNPAEVISKCRLLEAWSKANGYIAAPPLLRIQWGASGIFDNYEFILTSATYTLKNFQNGHRDRRVKGSQFVDTKLFPMTATQELVFKRVADHNLGYGDIINEEETNKTKGVVR